ncbi:hypothetical protein QC764_0045890 [Podospora pseudoanserina]|uniref:Uncharacterized protein n=1 Tax=Podospora pseudoanserina TaxID=2609844 RepID=A0ABR0IK57_9PEZI|nr:hypothetical protein QC764_0045890 [Podospora pseudoanserina]
MPTASLVSSPRRGSLRPEASVDPELVPYGLMSKAAGPWLFEKAAARSESLKILSGPLDSEKFGPSPAAEWPRTAE